MQTSRNPIRARPSHPGDVDLRPCVVGQGFYRHQAGVEEAADGFTHHVADLAVIAIGKLARLRAATGLKMPDCCVLLAVETTTARLATFDDRLRKAATARDIDTVDS